MLQCTGMQQGRELAQTLSPIRSPPDACLAADADTVAMSSMDMSLAKRGEIYHAQSRNKPVMRFFPSLAQHPSELAPPLRPFTAFVSRSPPRRPVEAVPDSLSAPQLAHDDAPVAAFHSNPLAALEDSEDQQGGSEMKDESAGQSRPRTLVPARGSDSSENMPLPAGPTEVSDFLDQQYSDDWSDVLGPDHV